MKKLIRIILPTLLLFPIQTTLAEEKLDTHLKFKPTNAHEFKPHMLSHIYEGCPDNSECSKEMGQKRKKWLSVLSNKNMRPSNRRAALNYVKKSIGVPLGFWYLPKPILHKEVIFWQSPCSQHNTKINPLRIAEGLFSNFGDLEDLKNKDEKVFPSKTYTYNNKKKIISYYLPRGDTPLMVKNKKLYFVREAEGSYYNMTIDRKGNLDIVKPFKPKEYPSEITCPKDLLTHMKSQIKQSNLYLSYFCKAVWDKSNKKFQTFIFGWSCN
ncbi:MAG: hypothetical protein HN576_06255 [Bacteriovoracaceae bacterium]|jgi:hypothetical protein|nr:hypothetical protein [Bacteriovoracaceae bacterium]